MKKVGVVLLFVFLCSFQANAQKGWSGYYFKKGHNQNFKFSSIGLEAGYFYPWMRFYNVVYLPHYGSERFNGNVIPGGHLEFHLVNGIYLRGNANYFGDKLNTQVQSFTEIVPITKSESIELNVAILSLSLLYEIQIWKRYFPFIGVGTSYNYYRISKTTKEFGRPFDPEVEYNDKFQAVLTSGVKYTVNGRFDIGLEGRFSYGRLMHRTLYRPFKVEESYIPIGVHGFMALATASYRFDSRYFRRKTGRYDQNPGTSIKR